MNVGIAHVMALGHARNARAQQYLVEAVIVEVSPALAAPHQLAAASLEAAVLHSAQQAEAQAREIRALESAVAQIVSRIEAVAEIVSARRSRVS